MFDNRGQVNGIASVVVGLAVAAVVAIVGISIFNTVNSGQLVNRQESWAGLYSLLPTIIAAVFIIGAIASILILTR